MVIWLRRGLLCFCLLVVAVFAVFYFWSASIVEAILLSKLEARGGRLELGSIRLRPSGIEVGLESYEEAGFLMKGLRLDCTWSQVLSISDGFSGQLSIVELQVRPSAPGAAELAEKHSAAERVAAMAGWIDGLPLQGVEVAVSHLLFETGDGIFRNRGHLSIYRSSEGETQVEGTLEDSHLSLNVRVKVPAGGEKLALDFVGSANDWAGFQAKYLPALSARLSDAQVEFYANPLEDGGAALYISGYARWSAAEADELSFTLLADLGPSELYFANGECILKAASFGLAMGGAGTMRGFAKGAVDSVRYGSLLRSGGDWALRVDGAHLAGELRLGEEFSVSLGIENWHRAMGGTGSGQFYFEADPVDAAFLRVFPFEGIPGDLELEMGIKLEGSGVFKAFRMDKAKVEADFEVRQAALPSRGLILRDPEEAASGHLTLVWREGQVILTDGQLEVDTETGDRMQYDFDGLQEILGLMRQGQLP